MLIKRHHNSTLVRREGAIRMAIKKASKFSKFRDKTLGEQVRKFTMLYKSRGQVVNLTCYAASAVLCKDMFEIRKKLLMITISVGSRVHETGRRLRSFEIQRGI